MLINNGLLSIIISFILIDYSIIRFTPATVPPHVMTYIWRICVFQKLKSKNSSQQKTIEQLKEENKIKNIKISELEKLLRKQVCFFFLSSQAHNKYIIYNRTKSQWSTIHYFHP